MQDQAQVVVEDHDLEEDDDLLDMEAVRRFWGGTKPVHRVTIYRLMNAGIVPKPYKVGPNTNRWRRTELKAARARRIAQRDGGA
jgi:predicted DNA-binding transcriptional regulator AlpA